MNTTHIGSYNGNRIEARTQVRNRVMRRNAKGELYAHEMLRTTYAVFCHVKEDGTTANADLTRFFGSKAEAIKYAKSVK